MKVKEIDGLFTLKFARVINNTLLMHVTRSYNQTQESLQWKVGEKKHYFVEFANKDTRGRTELMNLDLTDNTDKTVIVPKKIEPDNTTSLVTAIVVIATCLILIAVIFAFIKCLPSKKQPPLKEISPQQKRLTRIEPKVVQEADFIKLPFEDCGFGATTSTKKGQID